jgi:enoyl-CoA hydratase
MTVDADQLVRYQTADGVATVTLDSPANRNALSAALIDQLSAALARADADDDVRAVVLTHTGSTFCAGADLREALSAGPAAPGEPSGLERSSLRLLGLLRAILALGTPVVARIDGHVRAGGLGLIGACDVVVAGPACTFAFTEARLALAPAVISLVTTPRLTSRAVSRYYLTAETFDAAEAARIGLITQAADDPTAATEVVLAALREGAPQGLAESKRLVNRAVLADLDARGPELAAASAALFGSEPARAAMAAFTARRSR